MKRKEATDREMLDKLQQNIEKLLAAAERLASAADQGRRQIDRLAQLIAQAEENLRRTNHRGISIEGQDTGFRPVDLTGDTPDDADADDEVEDDREDDGQEDFTMNFGFGHFVEFSSYEELKKFQKSPPISGLDIEECDLDDVIRQLMADTDGEE